MGGELLDGERPRPVPGDGEALVRVEACSIGLTVLNCIRGDLGADDVDLPRVPGHELVGKVAAVGHGVDPARVGERVMAYFYLCCGECRRCLEGPESLCDQLLGVNDVHHNSGYTESTALQRATSARLPGSSRRRQQPAIPDAIATPVHVAAAPGVPIPATASR